MKANIKKLFCILASAIMLLGGASTVCAESNVYLKINGKEIETEVSPLIMDGRTMVPVRVIFEAVGADIDFNAETKTITATKDNKTVKMVVGEKTAIVNNKRVEMDASAVIVNGRTLAPARFVAESFGYKVQWNSENKTVEITGNTEFYTDYMDLPDYGTFSGADLLENESLTIDGCLGQGYIYNFEYNKNKFSSGDVVDTKYVEKLEENGWKFDGKAYSEWNAEVTLYFKKGPMLCSYSVCNNHQQVTVVVVNLMGKDIDIKDAVTV